MGTKDSPEPKLKPRFRGAKNRREPLKNLPPLFVYHQPKVGQRKGQVFPRSVRRQEVVSMRIVDVALSPISRHPRTCENTWQVIVKTTLLSYLLGDRSW